MLSGIFQLSMNTRYYSLMHDIYFATLCIIGKPGLLYMNTGKLLNSFCDQGVGEG